MTLSVGSNQRGMSNGSFSDLESMLCQALGLIPSIAIKTKEMKHDQEQNKINKPKEYTSQEKRLLKDY